LSKKRQFRERKLPFFSLSFPEELLPETQSFDYGAIALDIIVLEILQNVAPLADQTQQRALGSEVVAILFEVFRKVVDTERKQRDLTLGRTRVAVRRSVLAKKLLLFL
jgi:hypothetical protein